MVEVESGECTDRLESRMCLGTVRQRIDMQQKKRNGQDARWPHRQDACATTAGVRDAGYSCLVTPFRPAKAKRRGDYRALRVAWK
jgi:hypothetical protein